MTRYLQSGPFVVGPRDRKAGKAYRDNYDKVFRQRRKRKSARLKAQKETNDG